MTLNLLERPESVIERAARAAAWSRARCAPVLPLFRLSCDAKEAHEVRILPLCGLSSAVGRESSAAAALRA